MFNMEYTTLTPCQLHELHPENIWATIDPGAVKTIPAFFFMEKPNPDFRNGSPTPLACHALALFMRSLGYSKKKGNK